MKKFLGIILLVALTLVTFGCKPHVEQNFDKVKKWKQAQVINGTDFVNVLRITADNGAIDWWVVTDEDGVLYEEGVDKDYIFVDENGKKIDTPTGDDLKIAEGESLSIKFNDRKEAVVLIIYQPEVAPSDIPDGADKESLKGSEDFRGKFTNLHNSGYEAKASKYGESVDPYGIIELTCDEDGDLPHKAIEERGDVDVVGGFWSGDYMITEVWPLTQNGAAWDATQNLKFIFDEDKVVNEGETVRLVFPAGKCVFAIKQPSRFTEEDKANQEATYKEQKNWYWCVRFEEGNEDDGFFGEVQKHQVKEISSSKCKWHFDTVNKNFAKSALGATYIIDDAYIVYASSEK